MSATLCLLVWLLGAELQHLDNLAPNPSFDVDANRDLQPDGWTPNSFQSQGMLEWNKTVSRSGEASLRASDPGTGLKSDWKQSSCRWASLPRPVQSGTRYAFEVWVKSKDLEANVRGMISWQTRSKWLAESPTTQTVAGTQDWQKLTVTAEAPSEADEMILILELRGGKGTVWFDDIQVSGISEPLPAVEYTFNDTKDWFPFGIPLTDTNRDSIDLSHFLHAPAGKFGFVSAKPDGHFYFENGKRARFFGTSLNSKDCAPEKPIAEMVADRFAKYGVNLVRFHAFDSAYAGLFDPKSDNSQQLDHGFLDRMDYLIAQLKQRGIYVYMDLLDYRMFKSGDGVKHADDFTHNWAGSMKGASIFDRQMIELQKSYATKLLTHRNNYTGLRYVDDPAIALVETTNENSVFYFLSNAKMSLPYYRAQLHKRWNQWLADRYGTQSDLRASWTAAGGTSELSPDEEIVNMSVLFPQAEITRFSRGAMPDRLQYQMGPLRMADALRFLSEVQQQYFDEMQSHLKDVVGVRVPISGTNQSFTIVDTAVNANANDFTCGNQYWNHPDVHAKPFPRYANISRLQSDVPGMRGPMPVLARNTTAGKPMVVTEFNYPWPASFRAEGLMMSTAYACLQDWDGFLLYSYSIDNQHLAYFNCGTDPMRWGQFPAAAAMFHRNDVSPARNQIDIVHPMKNRFVLQPDERSSPSSTFRYLTFLSKVRNVFPIAEYQGEADAVLATGSAKDAVVEEDVKVIRIPGNPWQQWQYEGFVKQARRLQLPGYQGAALAANRFVSDTHELDFDFENGTFTINTPRTKSVIGFLKAWRSLDGSLGDSLSIENVQVPFASINVTSMDDLSIGLSKRILVTAVSQAEHTAQGFWPAPSNPKSWSPHSTWQLTEVGRLPVIAEPVDVEISIEIPSAPVRVYILDATGKRRKEASDVLTQTSASGKTRIKFNPSKGKTIWHEIVCE